MSSKPEILEDEEDWESDIYNFPDDEDSEAGTRSPRAIPRTEHDRECDWRGNQKE